MKSFYLKKILPGIVMLVIISYLITIRVTKIYYTPSQREVVNNREVPDKSTINMWFWNEEVAKIRIDNFNKVYPKINVNFTLVTSDDYVKKLQCAIASDSEIPDIIAAEMGRRGAIYDMDILEDLEKPPYNVKRESIIDYEVPLISNSRQQIVGLEETITPCGLAYRRDLAKKYLGTDDPGEIAEMIDSWEHFIEVGKSVKIMSEGKVLMVAGMEEVLRAVTSANSIKYIQDNVIDVTAKCEEALRIALKMRDEGIIGNYQMGTPEWSQSYTKGEFLFYLCTTWSPQWDIAAYDKGGMGRWGLTKAPGKGFIYGGTTFGIYKDSKNKEDAWKYINFSHYSIEGSKYLFEKTGELPSFKAFYKDSSILEKGSSYNKFFNGQKIEEFYMKNIVPDIQGQYQTKYDTSVFESVNTIWPLLMKDKSIDLYRALNILRHKVKEKELDAVVK